MNRYTLPFPPSVNSMFLNVPGKGRIKSKEYKAWTTEALWSLKAQKARPVEGEVSIWIGLVAPSKRAMDASNRIKSVEDILVAGGVIQDDSGKYVRRISAEWLPAGEPCVVIVSEYQG
jgi:crossover junction endodeoxyribonuclease RusA